MLDLGRMEKNESLARRYARIHAQLEPLLAETVGQGLRLARANLALDAGRADQLVSAAHFRAQAANDLAVRTNWR